MKNMKEAGGSEAFKSILSTTNFDSVLKSYCPKFMNFLAPTRSPGSHFVCPISPPPQNHITASFNILPISLPPDQSSFFQSQIHLVVSDMYRWASKRGWPEFAEGGDLSWLKAVIWVIWRWWYELALG